MNKNGVKFDDKHSITDWDLLMTYKNIGEAILRTEYVIIPGRDGYLDLSDVYGEANYDNRTLDFQFDLFGSREDWWEVYDAIKSYLHGKKRKIILDVDNNYYYYGRCSVSALTHEKNVAHLSVSCNCDPYKMLVNETVVQDTVSVGDTITLNNLYKKVMPVVESTGNIVFKFNNSNFSVSEGTSFQSPDFVLKEGSNTVEIISGSGTLKFTYREGRL